MENDSQIHQHDNQIEILKFMEVTECQSYQQAKFYVAMNNYVLKDAIAAYISSKEKLGMSNRSTDSNLQSPSRLQSNKKTQNNQMQIALTSQQARIFQQRLKSNSSGYSQRLRNNQQVDQLNDNLSICARFTKSCKKSFKCFSTIKKGLKKKINSMKKDDQRIFYFQQLYQSELQQAGFQIENGFIQSFELTNFQQNQKIKAMKNQQVKSIFALVVANRKSSLISSFLKNHSLMEFIRQNFEIIFLTLSELKQLQLPRNHSLRNIRKCPTAIVYLKNYYDLQDVLIKFQGQQLKNASIQKFKQQLQQVPKLLKKWNYLLQLQKQLKQNSITSLNQVMQFQVDSDQQHQNNQSHINYPKQHIQTKKSLIQQQTKIYQQMVAEQVKRKKSVQIQKQKLDQLKELRQIRKMSLPDQPPIQQIHSSIEFRFRCPLNGQYITRRFLKDQKIDILYQFVDINQDIEFENQSQRNFDLFTSFPPTSLSDKKQSYLHDVFDQEKQNILIREV